MPQFEGVYPEFRVRCQQADRLKMSSPPNGRALAFPVIWGTGRQDSILAPQPIEICPPSDEELMAGLQAKDEKASLYDPAKGSAKGWIVQVAFSRARDRRAHLLRRGFYSGTDVETLHDTLVGETDVEHEVGVKLDFSQLRCAFEELTTIQRRTLELFYFEGLDLREISERLREPFGNVRHHFYRGLERLRKSPAVKRLRDNHNA